MMRSFDDSVSDKKPDRWSVDRLGKRGVLGVDSNVTESSPCTFQRQGGIFIEALESKR